MKYLIEGNGVRTIIKDKDLIQRINDANKYKLRVLVGAYFIKLTEGICGIREFDGMTIIDIVLEENIERILEEIMEYNGMTFEEVQLAKDGQYRFIL